MSKVALVTGASSGIGLETAFALMKKGYKVYGAARHIDLIKPIESEGGVALFLDLCDKDSVASCVKSVIEAEGRIDLLVNNAGYGLGGAIEDVSVDEARRQFEVNLFGLAEITKAVLPTMRAQESGKIINVSSIAGRFSSPYLGWYHATKYSLEAFSDALRIEVVPFGIDVVVIEPGMINTPWGRIAAKSMRDNSKDGPYAEDAGKVADFYEKNYSEKSRISPPSVISKAILKATLARHPKRRYLAGKNARAMVFLRNLLNDRVYDFAVRKIFGLR